MAKIQVWYHANCDDGFGAAWAAYKFFEKHPPNQKVIYLAVEYNKPNPPVEDGDVVYIVDFSYPLDVLRSIVANNQVDLWILDHHIGARDILEQANKDGIAQCIFDNERSGAAITWNFFHEDNLPLLLRYVQANDLWKHDTMPSCKEVIRYIRSFKHKFDVWTAIDEKMTMDLASVIDAGSSIERFFMQQLNFALDATGKLINFAGHSCPVANVPKLFSSDGCHTLMQRFHTEIAMTYFVRADNEVEVSLRSRKEGPDVSKIAKAYGGGGHTNAAGFMMPARQFIAQIIEVPYHKTIQE